MILADTSVWIDLLKDEHTPQMFKLRELVVAGGNNLVMGDLVMFELLRGLSDEPRARLVKARLAPLAQVTISDPDIAVRAASHYRHLRGLGITVRKTVDTLIATRCIVDGHALLHRDRDFQPFVDHLGLIDAMTL